MLISPLYEKIKRYLESSKKDQRVLFFVPYIKTDVLSKLIENIPNPKTIITSWKPDDILSGSSELSLYPYCKENDIILYINNKVHLKVYSINLESAIIGSGNISNNGLLPMGNFEIAELVEKLDFTDRLYLERIKSESILVDDHFYDQYKKWYDLQKLEPKKEIKLEDVIILPKKDHFLISALPMTEHIQDLITGYLRISNGATPSTDPIKASCILHDLANYGIPMGLSLYDFEMSLKSQFFSHPFIVKIDSFINPDAHFGSIKEWVQKNCTDVPIPSRREITGNVQVLLEWFQKLGDGKYVIDVPGRHSQRIRRVK